MVLSPSQQRVSTELVQYNVTNMTNQLTTIFSVVNNFRKQSVGGVKKVRCSGYIQCFELLSLSWQRLLGNKCSFSYVKRFYRAANSVFGKSERIASEGSVLWLIKGNCRPILLHDLETCPLKKADLRPLDLIIIDHLFMKLFRTKTTWILSDNISQLWFA